MPFMFPHFQIFQQQSKVADDKNMAIDWGWIAEKASIEKFQAATCKVTA